MTNEEVIKALNHINLVRVHLFLDWEEMMEVRTKAISALEKQIPKKPIDREEDKLFGTVYKCQCNSKVLDIMEYCPNCGQAIDWSDM